MEPEGRDTQSRPGREHGFKLANFDSEVRHQDRYSCNVRRGLLEQLKLLHLEVRVCGTVRHPGDVAFGSGEARHEANADRIRASSHDDWNPVRCLPGRDRRRRRDGHDDVGVETGEFGRESWEALSLPSGGSALDNQVSTLDIPKLTEPRANRRHTTRTGRCGVQTKDSESKHPRRRLGLGGKRRGKKCSGCDQEVPAPGLVHAPSLPGETREILRVNDYCGWDGVVEWPL